jgi:hypothetical protein
MFIEVDYMAEYDEKPEYDPIFEDRYTYNGVTGKWDGRQCLYTADNLTGKMEIIYYDPSKTGADVLYRGK